MATTIVSGATGARSFLQAPGPGDSLIKHLRYSAFGVMHAMTEKKVPTTTGQATFLLAVIVDAIQLTALMLVPEFGWSSRDLQWLHDFSILDVLLPNRTAGLLVTVFTITVLLVASCLGAAVYVGHMFRTNNYPYTWPMKFLRYFVTVVITAGFIPTLQILLIPIVCEDLKAYMGASFECGSGQHIILLVMAVGAIVALLPVGLLSSLSFHDSNPNSSDLGSKSSGREAFYGALGKIVLVGATPFIADHNAVVALLYFMTQAALCAHVSYTLPYYGPKMNRLRAAITGTASFLAFGAVVSAFGSRSPTFDADSVTLGWVFCVPVATACCWFLPSLQYNRLHRVLERMRPTMERELNGDNRDSDDTAWADGATGAAGSRELRRRPTFGPEPRDPEFQRIKRQFRESLRNVDFGPAEHRPASEEAASDADANGLPSGGVAASVVSPVSQAAEVGTPDVTAVAIGSAGANVKPGAQARPRGASKAKADHGKMIRTLASTVVATYYMSMSRVLPLSAEQEKDDDGDSGVGSDADDGDLRRDDKGDGDGSPKGDGRGSSSRGVGGSRRKRRVSAAGRYVEQRSAHADGNARRGTSDDYDADGDGWFDGLAARDVELLVRIELSDPRNVLKGRRRSTRFRAKRGAVPTAEGLARAMWLFAAGIAEFADDAAELAALKILWATYLHAYTGDVNLATSALEAASRENPPLEGEFEVFTRLRTLQQERQSRDLGGDKGLNMIALVEYRKRLQHALRHHINALRLLNHAFVITAKVRTKIGALEANLATARERGTTMSKAAEHSAAATIADMHENIGLKVEQAKTSAKNAEGVYLRLLSEHSNAPQVAQAFGHFCIDVLNDQGRGDQYLKAQTSDRKSAASGTGSMGSSSIVDGIGKTQLVPKPRAESIRRMDGKFQLGILLVATIMTAAFVMTNVVSDKISLHLGLVGQADLQRRACIASMYHVRNLQLYGTAAHMDAAPFGGDPALSGATRMDAERNETLAEMDSFAGISAALYRGQAPPDDLAALWESPDAIPGAQVLLSGDPSAPASARSYATQPLNVWDALVAIRHAVTGVARKDAQELVNVTHTADWRFVFDNTLPHIFGVLVTMVHLYQEHMLDDVIEFEVEQGITLAALFFLLCVLGYFIMYRSMQRVQEIKRGVAVAAAMIPPLELANIRTSYKTALGRARNMATAITEAANDDAASDRGMSSDDASLRFSDSSARVARHDAVVSAGLPSLDTSLPHSDSFALLPGGLLDDGVDEGDADGGDGGRAAAGAKAGLSSAAPTVALAGVRFAAGPGARKTATATSDTTALSPILRTTLSRITPTGRGSGGAVQIPGTELAIGGPPLPTVVNAMATALAVCDSSGKVVRVNATFTTMLGYVPADVLGKPVATFLQPKVGAGTAITATAGTGTDTDAQPKGSHRLLTDDVGLTDSGAASPTVAGAKGTGKDRAKQVTVKCRDGSSRDVVLTTSFTLVGGEAFAVTCITDVSSPDASADAAGGDSKGHDDSLEDVAADDEGGATFKLGVIGKAILGLCVILCLQVATFTSATLIVAQETTFAAEINHAGRLRYLSHEVSFLAQELVIGDAELYQTREVTARVLADAIDDLEATRHALRFGGVRYGDELPGSANRNSQQDQLLFDASGSAFDPSAGGDAQEEASALGLDAFVSDYVRTARQLVDLYDASTGDGGVPEPVGAANLAALDAQPLLAHIQKVNAGQLKELLGQSTNLYIFESQHALDGVVVVAAAINVFNFVILCAVYLFLFRGVSRQMVREAERTETFLALLPDKLVRETQLATFFTVRQDLA